MGRWDHGVVVILRPALVTQRVVLAIVIGLLSIVGGTLAIAELQEQSTPKRPLTCTEPIGGSNLPCRRGRPIPTILIH